MKDLLTYYCEYNIWANEQLTLFFGNKPEALLGKPIENSFPSIRKTALHILSAERSWLARMQQDPTNNNKVADDFDSTNAVFESLVNTSKAFLQFVAKQDIAFFEEQITYHTWDGMVWEMQPKIMVHHCMNHSTYHRGQLITLARQLGMKEGVPSTDLLYFSREK